MKRLTLFCGHFGSGKTNIAVNCAEQMAAKGLPVSIADLDIVNPYFRTKDSERELEEKGIEVVTLPFANTNVDLPSLPKHVYSLFTDRSRQVVLDIGGDDRGALVLGRFAPMIREDSFDLLYVVNFYRYLTRTPEEALQVMREIEGACHLPFTGIVNNSNLGPETTAGDVLGSVPKAEELSALSGLPVAMTTVMEGLEGMEQLKERIPGLTVIRLQNKIWNSR